MYILFLPEATCLTQCKMYRCQHNGTCRGMKHVNDTVLLKQKKRSVLDIAGLFFSMSTCLCTKAKKKKNQLYPIRAALFRGIFNPLD